MRFDGDNSNQIGCEVATLGWPSTHLEIIIIGVNIIALGLLAQIVPTIKLDIPIHVGIQGLSHLVGKWGDAYGEIKAITLWCLYIFTYLCTSAYHHLAADAHKNSWDSDTCAAPLYSR